MSGSARLSSTEIAAFAAATQRFHARLAQAHEPLARAKVLLEWADACLAAGRFDEAVPLLEQGLDHLAEPVPRRSLGTRIFAPRPAPPEVADAPPAPGEAERLALAADLLDRLAIGLQAASDPERAELVERRAAAVAARLGASPRLARAIGREATALAEMGETAAADAHLAALRDVSTRLCDQGDPAAEAAARVEEARALLARGALGDVERAAAIAREMAERAGPEAAQARRAAIRLSAWAAILGGRPRESLHLAEMARRAAVEEGTAVEVLETEVAAGLAEALSGEPETGRKRIAAARERLGPAAGGSLPSIARLAAAEAALVAGDWRAARSLAAEARGGAVAPTLRRLLPYIIEADACLAGIRAEGTARVTAAEAWKLLADASSLAEEAHRAAGAVAAFGPRLRRIRGEIEAERGRPEEAAAALERLLPEARDVGGPVETARTLLAIAGLSRRGQTGRDSVALLGEAARVAGGAGAETLRRLAEALAGPETAGAGAGAAGEGAHRELASLLEVGRAVSSILELDPLLERIMDTIVEALHAERGFLMLYDEPRPLEGEAPARARLHVRVARNLGKESIQEPDFQVSRTVIAEVERSGQPAVVSDALRDPRFQQQSSVLKLKLHSILCFPLKTTRTFYGILYVDNRSFARLFGPHHVELMLPFAAQAAVAIENAFAFTQIRELYKETLSIAAAREKILNHVSHELKTPIGIIRGAIHLLGRKLESDPETGRTVARAERHFQRLIEIQQAMTDIYRGRDLDRMPPEPLESVPLRPLLEEVVAEAREKGPERDLEVTIAGGEGLTALAPRRPLEVSLRALLRNAIENTPDEGRIEIVLRPDVPDVIEVTVRDFGIGITADNQKHIFQGFFHTQPTESYSSKRPFQFAAGGKGLELLRLKTFADRWGWEISFESERCRFIPREEDLCPGRISRCPHCVPGGRETCLGSGRTEFRLVLPAATGAAAG